MLARHLRRRRVRAQALRHDLLLLLDRPPTPPLATRDQLDMRTPCALTISLMSVLSLCRRQQRRVHLALPSRHDTVPQCVRATSLTDQSRPLWHRFRGGAAIGTAGAVAERPCRTAEPSLLSAVIVARPKSAVSEC